MEVRLSGVQADTHPYQTRVKKRTLCCNSCRDGIVGTLEADKERVALRIDLASVMSLKHLAQHATVLRAQVTVRGTVPP